MTMLLLYIHNATARIHITYTNISGNIVNNNDDFNERTNTLLYKKYTSHTLFERVDVGCVWEVSWRWGQTATCWPKVLLTIAALLSHSGWAAQPWVTEGRKPSVCKLILTLASCPQLTPTGTWTDPSCLWHLVIFLFDAHLLPVSIHICTKFNHVHRSRWYSYIFDQMHLFRCSSTYIHRCIPWLTARSRVNMLHVYHLVIPWFSFKCKSLFFSMCKKLFSCLNFWDEAWWFLSLRVSDYCLHL